MDMFMDKLAQKLNAQEIIRANAAADAEEMNKLKNQIAEYNDCLTKLQKLIEEGTAALQNAEAGSEDIHRITEEAIGKIQAIQQNNAGLEQVSGQLTERLEHLETEMGKKLEEVSRQLGSLSEEGLAEKFAAVDENTHKECVKVYRNVQAVVVEESGKQTEAAENVSKTVNALGGKVSAILGISVAALVFSLAGVVLQILNALNIQLF